MQTESTGQAGCLAAEHLSSSLSYSSKIAAGSLASRGRRAVGRGCLHARACPPAPVSDGFCWRCLRRRGVRLISASQLGPWR